MNLLYRGYGETGSGETVEIDGVHYPVNYQYYYILKIIEILGNDRLDDSEKLGLVLEYFYAEHIPDNHQMAVEKCFEFIKAGNYQHHTRRVGGRGDDTPLYDYTLDHQLIFASMCQAYGEAWYEWHWWRWKAAFDHLPDTSPIKQVISIRGRKIDSKMSPKERANLRELKELYSLKPQETELTAEELEAKILAS